MSYETLEYWKDDTVAVIRFNRPERYNALDAKMARELLDVAVRVSHDPDTRALVVTGAGRAFSGGGDIKSFVEAGDAVPELVERMTVDFHAYVSKVIRMDKPVLAAVNGPAAGGGFSLAMSCDLLAASSNAVFSMAYRGIGASPDGSSTFTLPRLLGLRRAMELALTPRTLSAAEALDWGLVNRVLPAEGFFDAALDWARELARGPTLAYGKVKQLLYHSHHQGLESQMELESRAIIASARTHDFLEGIHAFAEKREPQFKGE